MSFIKKVKKLKVTAAGEMFKEDLDKGGEYYEARLELEKLCKDAGVKCTVKPFDVYQGPFADVENGKCKLWFGSEDGQFFLEKGSEKFEGDYEECVDKLTTMAGKHLKLVKSFLQKITAKYKA